MPAAIPYKGKDSGSRPADDGGALKGAAFAFGAKPAVKPKPVDQNYSGTNGALAAALKVGSTHLQPPPTSRSNSDSLIAANLAASRSPSLSPMSTGQRPILSHAGYSSLHPQRSGNLQRSPSVSSSASREYGLKSQGSLDVKYVRKKKKAPSVERNLSPAPSTNQEPVLDTTPIAPTNKLISIFEDKTPPRENPPEKSPRPSLHVNTSDVEPRDPVVISNGPGKGKKPLSQAVKPTPKSPKPAAFRVSTPGPNLRRQGSVRSRPRPSQASQNDETSKKESPESSNDSFVSASDFKENESSLQKTVPSLQKASKPVPPPPRRTTTRQISSEDRGRRHSMEYHGAYIPHLSDTSHFNAKTASSLASSRAASPIPFLPPIPPRSNRHSLFHHHQQRLQDSRTPSPAKQIGFRKTMRKDPPKDNEDYEEERERKGRKKLLHKHPNKHAEGDRRRWRDEITERERKRYEAVWASNKGLFLQFSSPSQTPLATPSNPPPTNTSTSTFASSNPTKAQSSPITELSEMVSNIAVRDIWKRSKLGDDVLEEVWDLVNRTVSHALTREEFVVGLWLIDQRLRGRKLPVRVGESVWGSAGRAGWVGDGRRR